MSKEEQQRPTDRKKVHEEIMSRLFTSRLRSIVNKMRTWRKHFLVNFRFCRWNWKIIRRRHSDIEEDWEIEIILRPSEVHCQTYSTTDINGEWNVFRVFVKNDDIHLNNIHVAKGKYPWKLMKYSLFVNATIKIQKDYKTSKLPELKPRSQIKKINKTAPLLKWNRVASEMKRVLSKLS